MPILYGGAIRRALPVKVWFEDQFLGDGKAYQRRAKEFAGWKRTELREAVMATLKATSEKSHQAARKAIDDLVSEKKIRGLRRHWVINGFSCVVTPEGFDDLKKVPGVRAIFADMNALRRPGARRAPEARFFTDKPEAGKFNPEQYKHPWYSRYLMADRVWKEFGVTGEGTLNIIHDFNFAMFDGITQQLYQNPKEIPGNGKDDDKNGYVDDYHGFNFERNSPTLTMVTPSNPAAQPQLLHGAVCATMICGSGKNDSKVEFGIAPRGRWAGVIGTSRLEEAVEWAIEHAADTYSMSFSIPGLGHYRSHWRKVMEHGSLCGIYFVSGAGNFAQRTRVPVQMRTPEDIPDVVFAAAGVQRNFSRTPFSSKGPVNWQLEHYKDGNVQKPEVCAFNMNLPYLLPNETALSAGMSGNSFAGPMFCGSIALMLSADKELLPWDLKEIITSTAQDIGPKGVDYETGHGLINCYRAVKEVLRRKAEREGKDSKRYTGRSDGDTLDVAKLKKSLANSKLTVASVQPAGQAAKLGLKAGDVITSYNGTKITSRVKLIQAKRRATIAKLAKVPVKVVRDDKTLEFEFGPGPLGFVPAVKFDDPVFR